MPQQSIESILSDKSLRVDFIFYVNKIHAQESLLFWMEVEMFKRITDADECAKQAKLLYFRYLHPSSKSEINVEGKLKSDIEEVFSLGVWDPSLFDDIQASVQECLMYSVVKSFMDNHARLKQEMIPAYTAPTPAHVVLERYDGMLHKHEKDLFPRNPLRWIHTKYKDGHPKKEKATLLSKSSHTHAHTHTLRGYRTDGTRASRAGEAEAGEGARWESAEKDAWISQHELRQQVQLLRNLHQYQQNARASVKEPDGMMKSASVPVIVPHY